MSTQDNASGEPMVTSPSMMRRVIISSTAGTALEWFDYFAYGTAAALIFNAVFFSNLDPVTGTLVAFLTFAAGFLMRPLGAIFFGHLGDKRGRRFTLILTMTIMGGATGLIGLLPTYDAIGVAAPILLLLLRLVQGFCLGGEWGGATTLVLEHAPKKRRARYQMFVQLGAPFGTLMSTGLFSLFSNLPGDGFATWGWRVPFLVSFLLLAIGLYMRLGIEESPLFARAARAQQLEKVPLAALLRTAWGRVIAGIFMVQLSASGFYVVTTFMTNYGTATLNLPRDLILNAILIGTVVQIFMIAMYSWLADRFEVTKVFIVAAIAASACAFPVFAMVETKETALVQLGIVIGIALVTSPFGIVGVILGRFFTDAIRYSGLAVTYNIGSLVGGFMPALGVTILATSGGSSWGVALLLAIIGLVSLAGCLLGMLLMRRHHARSGARSLYASDELDAEAIA
ncbi:MFS transporter [Ruicaihuangia caeni]|uniref:MFS transporter n=1 Tax=Ruicaihuangia caeni TaxID=3042517 RepID=A0AAW6T5Z0_9MICO|nr:MFS transporter [Klugiella sp. YN-L-19]MDI2098649.1 MFS transporter [Klugiella sp. YN-L-19]